MNKDLLHNHNRFTNLSQTPGKKGMLHVGQAQNSYLSTYIQYGTFMYRQDFEFVLSLLL